MKMKAKPKLKHKFKLEPGFKQFLWKTALFIAAFMVFSFIIGTQIFKNDFIDTWKIGIYARIGYILLFSIAGFILLYRKRLTEFSKYKYRLRDFLVFFFSLISF